MDVEKMEAGPELDILMCKHVMEWAYDDAPPGYPAGWDKPEGQWVRIDNFCPSEDIADAWQVVEKLKEKGYYTYVTTENPCRCAIYDSNSGGWDKAGSWDERLAETTAATVPLAICRAALLAIQQE